MPEQIECDDAYMKSLIDLFVVVSKKYQYLGIELIDIIIIILIVGMVHKNKNNID
jgi:hypothetical protein